MTSGKEKLVMLFVQKRLDGRIYRIVINGIQKLRAIIAILVVFRLRIPLLNNASHILKIRMFKHVARTVSTTANFVPCEPFNPMKI